MSLIKSVDGDLVVVNYEVRVVFGYVRAALVVLNYGTGKTTSGDSVRVCSLDNQTVLSQCPEALTVARSAPVRFQPSSRKTTVSKNEPTKLRSFNRFKSKDKHRVRRQ